MHSGTHKAKLLYAYTVPIEKHKQARGKVLCVLRFRASHQEKNLHVKVKEIATALPSALCLSLSLCVSFYTVATRK